MHQTPQSWSRIECLCCVAQLRRAAQSDNKDQYIIGCRLHAGMHCRVAYIMIKCLATIFWISYILPDKTAPKANLKHGPSCIHFVLVDWHPNECWDSMYTIYWVWRHRSYLIYSILQVFTFAVVLHGFKLLAQFFTSHFSSSSTVFALLHLVRKKGWGAKIFFWGFLCF
jgi:hypothetical protein